jgi:hypothetical protein
MIQKKLVLPILRAVAHCGEENAAFAMHAGPRAGIRMALITGTLEFAAVDGKNHVKIRRKIL